MSKLEAAVVTLADGQKVKFGRGEKVIKLAIVDDDGKPYGLQFVGRNGRTVDVLYTDYPDNVKAYLLEYGTKQRHSDGYASLDDPNECLDRVAETDARFAEGIIEGQREAPIVDRDLVTAIMELFDKSADDAKEYVRGLKPAERDGFRQDPNIKAVIDRLANERAAKAGGDIAAKLAALKNAAESARVG